MPPGKISTPAFTAAMPSPIGIITSGSSTPLRPQVNQQDAQQNQPDTRIHDRGIGLQQGRDSLENIAKIKPFHGALV